jgi:hypothetical protein
VSVIKKDTILIMSTDSLLSEINVIGIINGECASCMNKIKNWVNISEKLRKYEDVKMMIYINTSSLELFRKVYYPDNIKENDLCFIGNEFVENNNMMFKNNIALTDYDRLGYIIDKNKNIFLNLNPNINKESEEYFIKTIEDFKVKK